MATLNKVMILGNVTRTPEVRYTPKGTAVTDVGVALNRNYTLDNGEKREETTFVDVTLWGRTAELAGQYLTKGRPVFFEGRLQMDTWDDRKTGEKRSRLKVVGDNMQFVGGRGEGDGGGSSSHSSSGGGYSRESGDSEDRGDMDRGRDHGDREDRRSESAPPADRESKAQAAPSEEEDDIPF